LKEASELALGTNSNSSDGPRLLLASLALFEASVNEDLSRAVELRSRAIEFANRGALLIEASHAESWIRALLVEVYAWLALIFADRDDLQNALIACDAALAINPDHKETLLVRAWLTKKNKPDESLQDILRAQIIDDLRAALDFAERGDQDRVKTVGSHLHLFCAWLTTDSPAESHQNVKCAIALRHSSIPEPTHKYQQAA
jgi:hypothetical protein